MKFSIEKEVTLDNLGAIESMSFMVPYTFTFKSEPLWILRLGESVCYNRASITKAAIEILLQNARNENIDEIQLDNIQQETVYFKIEFSNFVHNDNNSEIRLFENWDTYEVNTMRRLILEPLRKLESFSISVKQIVIPFVHPQHDFIEKIIIEQGEAANGICAEHFNYGVTKWDTITIAT